MNIDPSVLDLIKERQSLLRSRTGGNSGSGEPLWVLVLKAAATLSQPFCLERLVIAAWKMEPTRFGQRGFETTYPDANIVSAVLAGKRGLVSRKELLKIGPKLYRLPLPSEEL